MLIVWHLDAQQVNKLVTLELSLTPAYKDQDIQLHFLLPFHFIAMH